MKKILAPLLALAITGCASYKPIPENYTGPIATIADTGQSEDSTKAKIFAITEIEGNRITSSFEESRVASHNQGAHLQLTLADRQVTAKQMKVTIRGSHITGAPIHEIASRALGTFFAVEGVVEFNPIPNGKYAVVGNLAKGNSSVWIEDAVTKMPVTDKVSSK